MKKNLSWLLLVIGIGCSWEDSPPVLENCYAIEIMMKRTGLREPLKKSYLLRRSIKLNSNKQFESESVIDLYGNFESREVTYFYDDTERLIAIETDYDSSTDSRIDFIYS